MTLNWELYGLSAKKGQGSMRDGIPDCSESQASQMLRPTAPGPLSAHHMGSIKIPRWVVAHRQTTKSIMVPRQYQYLCTHQAKRPVEPGVVQRTRSAVRARSPAAP